MAKRFFIIIYLFVICLMLFRSQGPATLHQGEAYKHLMLIKICNIHHKIEKSFLHHLFYFDLLILLLHPK